MKKQKIRKKDKKTNNRLSIIMITTYEHYNERVLEVSYKHV